MNDRAVFGAVLGAELIGAAAVLGISTRSWQAVTEARPRPFPPLVVPLSGHAVEPAVTAWGLVALAGVVAVLATRGWVRRAVGALVALAGAGAVVTAISGLTGVSTARARESVQTRADGGVIGASAPVVHVHAQWPGLAAVAAALVLLAGVVTALRGHRWSAMSTRYEAPTVDPQQVRARTDATMWNALDRGDDPTAGPGRTG